MYTWNPIGIIRSPFKERIGTPRQAAGAAHEQGRIEIFPEYTEGLNDIDGFSHLIVLFHMHLIQETSLTSNPPWDNKAHGVFATCSPFRPNHMGISVITLDKIEENLIYFHNVDMVDGSPVIDIKPYIPNLFPRENINIGWMKSNPNGMIKSLSGDK